MERVKHLNYRRILKLLVYGLHLKSVGLESRIVIIRHDSLGRTVLRPLAAFRAGIAGRRGFQRA